MRRPKLPLSLNEESQSSDVSHDTTVFLEVLVAIERSHSISSSSKSLELSLNFCFGHICSRLKLGYLFTSIEIESSSLFTIVVYFLSNLASRRI